MIRLPFVVLLAALAAFGLAGNGYSLEIGQGLDPSTPQNQPATAGKSRTLGNTAASAQEPVIQQPQAADYSANLKSDVFGANLFTGAFAREGATQFNPDYAVAVGDKLQVRFWGAFEFDAVLTVDPRGNIFLPHIGPLQVLGVRNQDLQRVLISSVEKVFRSNVQSYASLAAAQPVRVFVSGYVNRPGLYSGTSMDSLLHYLDQAGGIDPERGSFLNVQVKRGEEQRASVNLYDFLLQGRMPLIQLSDGDVIFVSQRQNTVKVSGLVENARRFEFSGPTLTVAELVRLAKPQAQATHVRVIRNTGDVKNTEYYSLEEGARTLLQNGDDLAFTADKRIGTITVRVEGEHVSSQEYVLPHGARFGELIKQIRFTERSDEANLQLFRQSARERQKLMFATALKSLEASVLTARSATSDEAKLRKEEADLILQWIDRAKKIEPSGQVVLARAADLKDLLLENGDVVKVPAKDGLVLINGEVLFPTTVVFDKKMAVEDYVRRAGGYTQSADTSRLIVAHRDGTFAEAKPRSIFGSEEVRPGDEILVLPRIDVKSMQIVKDLTQILFQLAVSTSVVLGL